MARYAAASMERRPFSLTIGGIRVTNWSRWSARSSCCCPLRREQADIDLKRVIRDWTGCGAKGAKIAPAKPARSVRERSKAPWEGQSVIQQSVAEAGAALRRGAVRPQSEWFQYRETFARSEMFPEAAALHRFPAEIAPDSDSIRPSAKPMSPAARQSSGTQALHLQSESNQRL